MPGVPRQMRVAPPRNPAARPEARSRTVTVADDQSRSCWTSSPSFDPVVSLNAGVVLPATCPASRGGHRPGPRRKGCSARRGIPVSKIRTCPDYDAAYHVRLRSVGERRLPELSKSAETVTRNRRRPVVMPASACRPPPHQTSRVQRAVLRLAGRAARAPSAASSAAAASAGRSGGPRRATRGRARSAGRPAADSVFEEGPPPRRGGRRSGGDAGWCCSRARGAVMASGLKPQKSLSLSLSLSLLSLSLQRLCQHGVLLNLDRFVSTPVARPLSMSGRECLYLPYPSQRRG